MSSLPRMFPWVAAGLAVAYLIVVMIPPGDPAGQMQVEEAGRLLVVSGGRFQPLDSYARTQMLLISKRQYYEDATGANQPAIRWMLDTLAMGLAEYYRSMQYVVVDDPEVVKFLELEPNPRNVYTIAEVVNKPPFKRELDRILKQEPKQLKALDRKLFTLAMQMAQRAERIRATQAVVANLDKRQTEKAPLFRIENDQVLAMLGLPMRSGLRYSWAEIREAKGFPQFEKKAKAAVERPEREWDLVDVKVVELYRRLHAYREVEALSGALLVPPPEQSQGQDWLPLGRALVQADLAGVGEVEAAALEGLLRAYGTGDIQGFNERLAAYQKVQKERYPGKCWWASFEAFFNHFAPFYQCTILYVLVFVLVCLSWLVWPEVLSRTALTLLATTFVLHTLALVARIFLQGRPPVTNLYSSAVFIGWGAVLLGLILEYIYKNSIGTLVGAALGFLTTLISHHLAASGDTLEMVQAVLDTNFWLATHVTSVTLGYVATFMAGFIAILYTVRGLFTSTLDRVSAKTLSQMVYGVICFATLLSFVGTVLGGVWADESWGRFWGWDPKENGALLIVAMNALILHARWGGMIKDRGMVVLAMCGNMVTLWSWFGTNQLGIGLHSYGVNKTLVDVCRYGWLLQFALILLAALVPMRYWRSFSAAPKEAVMADEPKPGGRRTRPALATAGASDRITAAGPDRIRR